MAWTQATDPSGDVWTGRCDQLDIFTADTPIAPSDFGDEFGLATSDDDILILEGFELDNTLVQGADAEGDLFTRIGMTGTPFSVSTTIRSATKTALNSLQFVCTATSGGVLRYPVKVTGSTYQYFRCYADITSYTNGNGSLRNFNFFGWVDSTGIRSFGGLIFPANGSAPKINVGHLASLGDNDVAGTVALSISTWYRFELVTEILAAGMTTTLYCYLGDTNTLVDSVALHSSGSAMGGFPYLGVGTANTGNALTLLLDDNRIQTATPSAPVIKVGGPLWGAGGVWPMVPLDSSTAQWTPLSGDNADNVDDFPTTFDGDTTYNLSSGTSLTLDAYTVVPYPDTVPDRKLIKAIEVRSRQRRGTGSGIPHAQSVYMVPGATTGMAGPSRGISDTTYGNYPITDSGTSVVYPHIFLIYPVGLNSEFASEQKIGIQRVAGTPTEDIRCTTVWGYMDIQ